MSEQPSSSSMSNECVVYVMCIETPLGLFRFGYLVRPMDTFYQVPSGATHTFRQLNFLAQFWTSLLWKSVHTFSLHLSSLITLKNNNQFILWQKPLKLFKIRYWTGRNIITQHVRIQSKMRLKFFIYNKTHRVIFHNSKFMIVFRHLTFNESLRQLFTKTVEVCFQVSHAFNSTDRPLVFKKNVFSSS